MTVAAKVEDQQLLGTEQAPGEDWTDRFLKRLMAAPREEWTPLERELADGLFAEELATVQEPLREAEVVAATDLRAVEAGLAEAQRRLSAHLDAPPTSDPEDVESWVAQKRDLEESQQVHDGLVATARQRHAEAATAVRDRAGVEATGRIREADTANENVRVAAERLTERSRIVYQSAAEQYDRLERWNGSTD